jgi:hypothetical protein
MIFLLKFTELNFLNLDSSEFIYYPISLFPEEQPNTLCTKFYLPVNFVGHSL